METVEIREKSKRLGDERDDLVELATTLILVRVQHRINHQDHLQIPLAGSSRYVISPHLILVAFENEDLLGVL